jgi:hypothetical protein
MKEYISPDAEDNPDDQKSRRFRSLIDKAKENLPLPALIRGLRDWSTQVEFNLCPFHDDNRPSFSLFQTEDGQWLWNCFAGCGCGDKICYLEVKYNVSRRRAISMFLELAGVGPGTLESGGGRFRV